MAYTRDGGLDLDSAGVMVHQATGERILGWMADPSGAIDTTTPLDATNFLTVPVGRLNTVKATDMTTWTGNLDANALGTDQVQTKMRVYDSLGGSHDLTIVMTNRSAPPAAGGPASAIASWDWSMYEGDPSTGTLLGGSASPGNERLYFDLNGTQVSNLAAGTYNSITVAPATAGAYPSFNIDVNFNNLSQLVARSQVNGIDQNGFPSGSLENYSISQDGLITGIFTNGMTRAIGQIGMATFANPEGLSRSGGNLFEQSDNAGSPIIGLPRDAGMGSVNAGYLEQSNIDMSGEMTDLIITQRGFQANTKIVTTVDEMLQELINIKR